MQRKRALATLVFTAAIIAAFLVSCQQPEMDDSIEPFEKYFDKMVTNGEKNVSLKEAVSYYLGEKINPDPDGDGKKNYSVYLRVQGGSTVRGTVDGFEFKECAVSPTIGCPLGVSFLSGGGPICDLSPNTDYELVIDNLVLADGSTLSKTVTFTTGPEPAGYTPSPCPFLISGNTLDPAQGISGALTGSTHDLDIVAAGIETGPPYNDYRNIANPRYIAILKILPKNSSWDLSTTVQWINLRVNGQDLRVELPGTNIAVGKSLVLYIAQNGSTYYALNTLDGTTNMSSGECDSADSGCPAYPPDQAYLPGNLAAGSSTDIEPLKIRKNAVDSNSGLNGGVLNGPPPFLTYFYMYAIQGRDPYYGWDQLNNSTDFQLGYHDTMAYYAQSPLYLRSFSPFVVGHIRSGGNLRVQPCEHYLHP